MRQHIDQAAEFVRRRGSRADVARLSYLLDGVPVSEAIRREVFASQHVDGGWQPFWASDYRSLDATCFRLAQAEQMGVGADDDIMRRAMAFLVGRQRPDGAWEEDTVAAAHAPPWAAPGKDDARAYLTANCGFWVAAYGVSAEQTDAAQRASDALAAEITADGRLPGFAHTSWLAAGLWRLTGQFDHAARVEEWLEQRVKSGLPASSLTWLLSTLRIAGASPRAPLARRAAAQLATQQRIDGGWPSEDGADRDAHVTLEAICAALWMERGEAT